MHAFKELPKRIYCEMQAQNDELILLDKIGSSQLVTSLSSTDFIPYSYSLYTQAYCKFLEILMVYPELTQISSPEILKFFFYLKFYCF